MCGLCVVNCNEHDTCPRTVFDIMCVVTSVSQVDLLCCDVDSIKLALASPQARADASVSSAAAARAAHAAVGRAQQLQLTVTEAPSRQEAVDQHAAATAPASCHVADLPDLVEEPAVATALHCTAVMPTGSAAAVLQQQASAPAVHTGPARAVHFNTITTAAGSGKCAAGCTAGARPAASAAAARLWLAGSAVERLVRQGEAAAGWQGSSGRPYVQPLQRVAADVSGGPAAARRLHAVCVCTRCCRVFGTRAAAAADWQLVKGSGQA